MKQMSVLAVGSAVYNRSMFISGLNLLGSSRGEELLRTARWGVIKAATKAGLGVFFPFINFVNLYVLSFGAVKGWRTYKPRKKRCKK